jgi:hypothetical protein
MVGGISGFGHTRRSIARGVITKNADADSTMSGRKRIITTLPRFVRWSANGISVTSKAPNLRFPKSASPGGDILPLRPLIPFRPGPLKFVQCPVLEPSQIRPSGNDFLWIMGMGFEPDQQTPALDVGYPRGGVIARKPRSSPRSSGSPHLGQTSVKSFIRVGRRKDRKRLSNRTWSCLGYCAYSPEERTGHRWRWKKPPSGRSPAKPHFLHIAKLFSQSGVLWRT